MWAAVGVFPVRLPWGRWAAGELIYYLIGGCGGAAINLLQYENNDLRRCSHKHVLQSLQ